MDGVKELRFSRRFLLCLQLGWLLLALLGLIFNALQGQREVEMLAHQAAALEKERSDTVRKWALQHGSLQLADGVIMSPAQVLSQVQALLPREGVHSRLVSPVPLNAANAPDSWERQALVALSAAERLEELVRDEQPGALYRELHRMEVSERCQGCHAGYADAAVPAALSIQVPLRPIENLLATKAIAFNLACVGIWALGAWGLRIGGRQLLSQVTACQQARHELHHSNNLYSALSAANQVMMRIATPQQLFEQICNIVVDYGQFQMASVARLDEDSRQLQPVARAGDAGCQQYLDHIRVSVDPDYAEGRGPTSLAIREQRTVVTNDFLRDLADSPWVVAAREAGIRASAALPILCDGRPLGALKVYADRIGYFTTERVLLLEQLRDDLAFALDLVERKQREAEAQRQLQESQRFQQVLLDALPYPAILARYSSRQVVSANRQALEMGVRIGKPSPCCQKAPPTEGDTPLTQELQSPDGRWEMVCWRPVNDSENDLYLHFAIDITDRKRQEEQVRSLAQTDALTGLANRLFLSRRLDQLVHAPQPVAFCLLVVDLDQFKPVNDQYGHTFGDQVLMLVAQRLQQVLRTGDLACRWGGDEFVVLLDQTGNKPTEALRQRLLALFESPFNVEGRSIALSASIGYACYPDDGLTEAELLKLADKRMYRDKQQRRSNLAARV
ncbi:diguanylate cyclase domain-containing protein [Trichloromonas sp.]|uniref:sensor domain-containing diguanylate cyclase n=1 Tax=Trichloromonas sp. TaxID=3069249 RepID=UPI002A48A5CA|nr:diguanylate cyclase [Trichloromonas sp.]